MAPLLAAALVTGGSALVQGVTGAIQKGKAKKMAERNKRPDYKISQSIKDNQARAESNAMEGMSDAAKQTYRQGAERGITSGISAITDAGGSVNNVGDLYGAYNDGISRMSLVEDEMRARNNQILMLANKDLAGEEDKEFQVDQWGPYADTAQAAAALSKQGSDNIWKGINTGLSAFTNYASGKLYEKEAGSVYGPNQMSEPPMVRRTPQETVQSPYTKVRETYPGLVGLNRPVSNASFNVFKDAGRTLMPGQIPAITAGDKPTPPPSFNWNTDFLKPVIR